MSIASFNCNVISTDEQIFPYSLWAFVCLLPLSDLFFHPCMFKITEEKSRYRTQYTRGLVAVELIVEGLSLIMALCFVLSLLYVGVPYL